MPDKTSNTEVPYAGQICPSCGRPFGDEAEDVLVLTDKEGKLVADDDED